MLGGMALQDGGGGGVPPPVLHEERIVEGQRDDANTGNNEGRYSRVLHFIKPRKLANYLVL